MTKHIPYKVYKILLVSVWLLAILCIIATWVGFTVGTKGGLIFGGLVDSLLAVALIALIVLLYINVRTDYKKRARLFIVLTAIHIIFFVLVLAFSQKLADTFKTGYYVFPVIHTIILIAICVLGVYFWIRNKFKFKSAAHEDAVAAFGGPIEEQKPQKPEPLVPEEPKPARDEKTGIVSL